MESSRNITNTASEPELFGWLGLLEDSDNPGSSSPAPLVITLLSSFLEKKIRKNKKKKRNLEEEITVFHCTRVPSMSIQHYIERIHKYAQCSPSCFVAAFAYIHMYLHKTNDAYSHLTSLNVHRLLITCLMVAAKFLDDECYNNAYYAKVGGVSKEEMNRLEITLLFDLDFKLSITKDTFKDHCLVLLRQGYSYNNNADVPCLASKETTIAESIRYVVSQDTPCSCHAI